MFIILSAVLNLGNVAIESNDEGEATVASGPGTPIRAVAVNCLRHCYFRAIFNFRAIINFRAKWDERESKATAKCPSLADPTHRLEFFFAVSCEFSRNLADYTTVFFIYLSSHHPYA